MSVDYDNLRNFVLASTKMHLSSQHVAIVMRQRLAFLESVLAKELPEDANNVMQGGQHYIDDAFKDMVAKTEDLLTALENFANG